MGVRIEAGGMREQSGDIGVTENKRNNGVNCRCEESEMWKLNINRNSSAPPFAQYRRI